MLVSPIKAFIKKNDSLYNLLVQIIGKIQDCHTTIINTSYQNKINKKKIPICKDGKLKDAFKERLASRKIYPVPKKKGELNIFLIFPLTDWEVVLPMSLEPFGNVNIYEWHSRGYDSNKLDWVDVRDKMNNEMLHFFFSAHSKTPIDIVISYLSGHTIAPEILTKMGNAGAVLVNFCWDDQKKFPGRKVGGRYRSTAAIASTIDLNLTNSPNSLMRYAVHGGLSMFWPEAAHPDIHHPYDIPFEYDVSFVGRKYAWRPIFIKKLKKMGINVVTFGPGWDNGPLSVEEMVKTYSRSRINLGFSGTGFSKSICCLKGRDFEIPMSSGLYLTQDHSDLHLVYDVDNEIMTYNNLEDCAKKIAWLLENPEKADQIRKFGRKKTLRDHTWEKRFEDLLRFVGLLE